MVSRRIAIRGTIVTFPEFGVVHLGSDLLLVAEEPGAGGRVLEIVQGSCQDAVCAKYGLQADDLVLLKKGQFLLPGFVDLHVHAPQYSYHGTATDRPLMEWLEHYTFPREGLHASADIAAAEYIQLVRRLVANGTTCALFFGSLHLQGCTALVKVLQQVGMRGLVGLTCMDRNSPDNYIKTADANIQDTQSFIDHVRGTNSSLVEAVITPRFVPTCTPTLLSGLGTIAKDTGTAVQSHISESMDEVAFARHLHPEVDGRDAQLFDAAGLLTQRCVMAHAVFLNDEELQLMASRGSAIAHCPLSNFFFADRLLRVKHCRKLGVKVGLGTDIAGGYSPSMLSSMRNAVIASKALRMQALREHQESGMRGKLDAAAADKDLISWKEALWLATQGGAEALGLQDSIGQLKEGMQLDALLVDCSRADTFDVYESDSQMDQLEKFATVGDDRNITGVWVSGKRLK